MSDRGVLSDDEDSERLLWFCECSKDELELEELLPRFFAFGERSLDLDLERRFISIKIINSSVNRRSFL